MAKVLRSYLHFARTFTEVHTPLCSYLHPTVVYLAEYSPQAGQWAVPDSLSIHISRQFRLENCLCHPTSAQFCYICITQRSYGRTEQKVAISQVGMKLHVQPESVRECPSEVKLWLTVSRPVCLGVDHPCGTHDQVFILKNVIFYDVTPCGSCKNRGFDGIYRLHHIDNKNRWARSNVSLN
jgi:hypothetical protein